MKTGFIKMKALALSAFCILSSELSVYACPLCRETIAQAGGLAKGFYWSILLMLGVPALVVAVISRYILKTYRQSR